MKKRLARKAERVGVSDTNPKLYKYKVEVEEPDGTISILPEYGVDMQDALSKIVRQYKIKKLQRSIDKLIIISVIILIVVVTLIFKS